MSSTSWAAGLCRSRSYSSDEPEVEESSNHPPGPVCALQHLGAGEKRTFFPIINTIWPLFKQFRKCIHSFETVIQHVANDYFGEVAAFVCMFQDKVFLYQKALHASKNFPFLEDVFMKRLFRYVFKSECSLHYDCTQIWAFTAKRISSLLCMQIYKAPGTFEINWKHSHVIKPNPDTSQGDPPSNTLEHPLPLSAALEH